MNESHFSEIERVLLYVSEARERAGRARLALTNDGAEQHLVDALRVVEDDLRHQHRRLMQSTLYAAPPDQARLAV